MKRGLGLAAGTLLALSLAAALGAGGLGASPAGQAERPTPLILISFDGFRWDYPERAATPTLLGLAERGVRAERLVPVFPSKTFPGHYAIATGLYPGHNGIVSNNMRDPETGRIFGLGSREEVQDPMWWGGEPIWVVAERAGLRSAVYFWPGSEAPVDGVSPEIWFEYDESVSYEARVDRAVEWVAGESGFDLVLLYFDEPNTASHRHGPLSSEALAQAARADGVLARLLEGLQARGAEANIVVVSDHGMALNSPERVIAIEDYVDLAPEELFEYGAMVQIHPLPGREEEIYEALAGAHPHMRVWRRGEIPERLHTADNPRLAPIVASPDSGWQILPRRGGRGPIPGNHGQDPQHPDMHGIFLAAGPDIRAGVRLPAIEQVDVFPFLAALLGLDPPAHDGDTARTAGLLR